LDFLLALFGALKCCVIFFDGNSVFWSSFWNYRVASVDYHIGLKLANQRRDTKILFADWLFQTVNISLYKLSKFPFLNCQNFLFKLSKFPFFKLSKFPFSNCQNFPFSNCHNFPFSNCQNFPFSNCHNFPFQTVKSSRFKLSRISF
jgi:hypothetical protein